MLKLRIAAWILSLATDPDRAATTVGDFSEEAAAHRGGRFWGQLARTLGAHITHDFMSTPGRLLLGLLSGLAFGVAAYAVILFASINLSLRWGQFYYSIVGYPQAKSFPAAPGFQYFVIAYVITALIAVGQCIARVSRRPLASWVLWNGFCTLLWAALALASGSLPRYPYETVLLVLLGAIWERRRALKTA